MSDYDKKGAASAVLAGFMAIAIGAVFGRGAYVLLKDVGAAHSREVGQAQSGIDITGLEPDVAQLVLQGHDIIAGKGLCYTCHKIGKEGNGVLGPDLTGIGATAATRVSGLSARDYIVQSLYEPKAYTVEGFIQGTMMPVTGPPSNLGPEDILKVVAYLESLDGTVTVVPGTDPLTLLPGGPTSTRDGANAPAADEGEADAADAETADPAEAA